jgi:hypothetical protein
MSRAKRAMKSVWAFLDRVGWVIAIVFVAIALHKLHNDETNHAAEARHTRIVQEAGEPVGVCLLDALEAVSPLLLRVPSVEKPLEAYVRLQSRRYLDVKCPDGVKP